MRHSTAVALLGAAVLLGTQFVGPLDTGGTVQAAAQGAIKDQYIVVLRDDVSDPRAVAQQHANANGLGVLQVYEHALKGYAAKIPPARLNAVRSDPRVEYVSEDFEVEAFAQTLPTGVDRIDGDLSSTASGTASGTNNVVNVDVAVIDTGIDRTHPDLNVVGGKNCSTGGSYNDGNGHGTHVAGTIGAKDDGNGVVGVAPGARLWAVRVLNNAGSGSWSSVICGIDWVTARASTIKVANMSLGGSGSDGACNSAALHQAICNSVAAGITYAVAAGNDSKNASTFVPAAYDEVITVSALADFNGKPGGGAASTCRTDVDDTFADFSNYGADVDLIAPGVCILSTWKGGGYNTISGTSMASPHVAGAAALYRSANSSATPSQVKTALQNAGTTDWSTGSDPDSTHEKLLNVDAL
jgi:subtilisin family serine protease